MTSRTCKIWLWKQQPAKHPQNVQLHGLNTHVGCDLALWTKSQAGLNKMPGTIVEHISCTAHQPMVIPMVIAHVSESVPQMVIGSYTNTAGKKPSAGWIACV